MPTDYPHAVRREPAVEAHLLGLIDYEACLALEQRLVFDASGDSGGPMSLLLCEHPPSITVGRQGSWAHIHLARRELSSRQLPVHWVNRGGGCLVHGPGQLAVYPIVALERRGFSVGDYLDRLQQGILAALGDVGFQGHLRPGRQGIWGRAGQVVVVGVAVRNWVSYFGAYINVAPAMRLFRSVDCDPVEHTPMSSLVIERQQPVRMSSVREGLVRHLTASLGFARYHLSTGHPFLARPHPTTYERSYRAG